MCEPLAARHAGPLRLIHWQVSHRGCERLLNEDRFVVDPQAGLFAVADGMGGHEGGDLASACIAAELGAVGLPQSALDLRARVEHRVGRANHEIRALGRERGGVTIGATLAALIVYGEQFAGLWAGDSRIYRLHDGAFAQISTDHTEVQELVASGVIAPDEAATYARRNVVTNAIGITDAVVLDYVQGTLFAGDRFVLCSDGLTAHLGDAEIEAMVAASSPREACEAMLALVLERGGSDNVTIVVLECAPAAI